MTEQTATETLLRAPEVVAQSGCTYRQLDYWTRAGHVHPADRDEEEIDPATPGSGRQRLWEPDEVEVIRRAVQLTDAGVSVAAAFRVARSTTPVDLGHGIVLTAPWMTT